MRKHREFWREVRKRGLAWLLVCLLVAGIVMPMEYGYANNGGEPPVETESELAEEPLEELSEEETDLEGLGQLPSPQSEGTELIEEENTPVSEENLAENPPVEEEEEVIEEDSNETTPQTPEAPIKKLGAKKAPAGGGIDWSAFTFDEITDPDSFDWMGINWSAIDPGIVNWDKVKWLEVDLDAFLDAYESWGNPDEVDAAIMTSSSFGDFKKAMGLDEISLYATAIDLPLSVKNHSSLLKTDGTTVPDGYEIGSLSEGFIIGFEWNPSELKNAGVSADTWYFLDIPGKIDPSISGLGGSGKELYKIQDNPSSGVFATLNLEGDKIIIKFTEAGLEWGGVANFGCSIDATKNDAQEDGTVDLNIGGTTLKVKIDELAADPSKQAKITKGDKNSAKVKADGTVEWTLSYDPGDPNWGDSTRPKTIVDTIPTEMNYVGEVTFTPNDGNVTVSETGGVITFTFTDDEAAKVERTFTYKTKINDEQITKIMDPADSPAEKYHNKAEMYNSTSTKIGTPAEHDVGRPDNYNNPFRKNFTSIRYDSLKNKYIATWTTVVDAYGANKDNIEKLTVSDSIDGKDYLSNIAEVKVNNGAEITDSTYIAYTPTTNPTSFELDLKKYIEGGNATADANGRYTITYTTEVSDSAYTNENASEVSSKTENSTDINIKLMSQAEKTRNSKASIPKTSVNNIIIKKESSGEWDIKDGEYGRKYGFVITVNENKLNVVGDSVIVTDYLPDNIVPSNLIGGISNHQLEYHISDVSVLENDGATVGTPTYYIDKEANTLAATGQMPRAFKVEISDISFKTVKLKVWVTVTDKYLFSTNVSNPGYQIDNNVNITNTSNTINQNATANHKVRRVKANAKSVETYDTNTQEITWKVSVNDYDNRIALDELDVSDVVPKGLEYVSGSGHLKIDGVDQYDIGENDGTYPGTHDIELKSQSNNGDGTTTLLWKVNVKTASKYEIYYKTKVDYDEFYGKIETTVFDNAVNIIKHFPEGTIVDERHAILTMPPLSLVDKQGKIDGNTNKILYEVGINPLKQTINSGTNGIILEDSLSSNLFFLEDSVQIYEAEVSVGAITDKENHDLGNYTYTQKGMPITPASIEYDLSTNTFKVVTPPLADNTTYLVKYTCLATAAGDIKNDVKVSGVKPAVNDQKDFSLMKFKVSAYGFSFYAPDPSIYSTLEVRKTNKGNDPIKFETGAGEPDNSKAAKFDVYDAPIGGHKLSGSIVANDKGLFIISKSSLSGLDSIWLEETNPPEGYMPLDGRIEVSVKDLDKGITVKNYVNEADKTNTVDLKVKKVDQNGNYQTAFDTAKFKLYSDESCTVQVGTEQTMVSAGITFTGLTEGKFYYLQESVTPSDYVSSNVIKILAGTNKEISVVNYKKAKLTVKKEDPSGNFVDGAKVTIYKDENKTILAKGDIGAGEILLENIEISNSGLEIDIAVGTYWIEESTVPDGYIGAALTKVEVTDAGYTAAITNTPKPTPIPDPPGGIGGDGPDDSSTPETTAPPVKPVVKTDANGNKLGFDGKIPQTGQLWWPVWLMGGLGSLFLILGFLWKPKKKK